MKLIEIVDLNSSEFKSWFAGSKVIDGRKKPLVCYHGTFKHFDPSMIHPLSHFGTLTAAQERVMSLYRGPSAIILEYYLSIKRPLVMEDSGEEEHNPENLLRAINYISGLWTNEEEDELVDQHDDFIKDEIIKKLKENNYDGIMYTNMKEDVGSRSWIILDSSQAWPIIDETIFETVNILYRKPNGLEDHDEVLYQLASHKQNNFLPRHVEAQLQHLIDPVNYKKAIQAAKIHQVSPQEARTINNTGEIWHHAGEFDRNKKNRVMKLFKSGEIVTTPIVLHHKKSGEKWLLAGNTRLSYNSQVRKKSTPVTYIEY